MKSALRKLVFLCLCFFFASTLFASKDPKITIRTSESTSIQLGDSITVEWNVSNAKKFYCYELSKENLKMNSSIVLKPELSTSYTFYAQKGRNIKKKKITIDVLKPVFTEIKIPESITDEEQISISWNAQNASYVIINGFDDKFTTSGKLPLKTTKDTIITLTAFNKNGYSTQISQKIKVTYVESLNYPKRISKGKTLQLTWSFKNTAFVSIKDMADSLPPTGEINFPIMKSQNLQMYVFRDNGDFEIKNINIEVFESEILKFSSINSVMTGEEATLIWEVKNADSLKLSCAEGNQKLKGMYKYVPEKSEFVTLTAYLNGLEDSKDVKVNIISRKYITGETDYSDIARGVRLDYEIFSVDMAEFPNVVQLYVLVVDSAGNLVHGLSPPTISKAESEKYFLGLVETYVGGGSKSITDFSVKEYTNRNDNPKDISVVLDYSGSMSGTISDLELSVKSFIKNKRNIDSLSVVKFDNNVNIEVPLTGDKEEILRKIKNNGFSKYGGSTALYAALGDGMSSLHYRTNTSPKEMVVFTDGFENASMFYMGEKPVSAQEVADIANKNNIRIHTISFGECVNENLLEVLSGYTGGSYYQVNDQKEINGIWAELPFLSTNYYVVSFKTNDISKINGIKLKYNDNAGHKTEIGKKIYTNTPINFNNLGIASDAYWMQNTNLYGKLSPISTPQVIALFELNGSIVINDYLPKIDSLVSYLNQDSTLSIAVLGHTDLSDTDEYNLKLSEKRCDYVKQYLVDKGIDEKRIITIPFGEKYPVWADENEDWKSKENRRIEVLFIK